MAEAGPAESTVRAAPPISPMRRFVTSAMIAFGIVMLALSGSCTAFFTIAAVGELIQGGHSGDEFGPAPVLALAAMLGAPPILAGVALIWLGRRLRRRPKPPPSARPPG